MSCNKVSIFLIFGKIFFFRFREDWAVPISIQSLYNQTISIHQLIDSHLTYSPELWIVSKNEIADTSGWHDFVSGRSIRGKVRRSRIWREFRVEPPLLPIKTSPVWWFWHLIRTPPGRLPLEVFQARPTGKRPQGRPRTRRRDWISHLAWESPGIPQKNLESVVRKRDIWNTLLSLLSLRPNPR